MNDIESRRIVNEVLKELNKKNLISTSKDSFKSTEKILYSYNALPEAIKLIQDEVKRLEEEYKQIKPSNATSNRIIIDEEDNSYVYGNESLINRISELKQIVISTKSQLRLIKESLKKIEKEKYYEIIRLYYFEGNTIPEIAEILDVSVGTISENKSKLINKLKVYLFPNTFIKEL